MVDKTRFPKKFIWGAATSAYQIEGAKDEDGKGESIWDRFSHTPGKIHNGDTGDVGCDHYHRYPEDIALLKKIGIPSYRFSVSWSRIFPQGKGSINRKGIDFYNRLVDSLLEAGIAPAITLYHWDLPQALEDIGGWAHRDVADYFADYASVVFKRLGDRVPLWITHNEPWVAAFLGYWHGTHAPGLHDLNKAVLASHHLLLSHGKAVQVFRSQNIQSKIGIALNIGTSYPFTDTNEDKAAAVIHDGYLTRWFLDPLFKGAYPADIINYYQTKGIAAASFPKEDLKIISAPMDFLGYNYYFSDFIQADENSGFSNPEKDPSAKKTAMGWPIVPEGLHDFLIRTKNDYGDIPLYITENGAAYDDVISADGCIHDVERIEYIKVHLRAIHRAMQAGVALHGYYVWSILDNFEWAEGYSKRFGIVHVDFATQKRTLKDSAYWFGGVIRDGCSS